MRVSLLRLVLTFTCLNAAVASLTSSGCKTTTKTKTTTVHVPQTETVVVTSGTETVIKKASTTLSELPTVSHGTTVTTTSTDTITDIDSSATSFITFSVVSTVAPTTTTILPSADFTPIRSQIAAQGYTPAKRDHVEEPREAEGTATTPSSACIVTKHTTKTKTVTTCTTITRHEPSETITKTSTKTITPKPLTSTFTSTNTVFTSTTTTVIQSYVDTRFTTITTTTSVATATYYAACATDNILSTVEGFGLDKDDTPRNSVFANGTTPYDCCVLSIQGNNAGSIFDAYPYPACYLVLNTQSSGQCAFDGTKSDFYLYPNDGTTYYISNGNCGEWVYAGVVGQPSALPPRTSQT